MKNLIFIILTVIIANIFVINAQDILWKKNFGLSSADDYGRSVIETSDGGIVIAGYTGSYGAGGFDVWLIKTNPDGDTLWTRTYGGSGDDYGYLVKQTEDSGFIIGGATNSIGVGGLDYYLIKTDSLGDTLWTKTFGSANDDICWSLESVADGYVLVGENDSNLYLLKTDLNGQFIWEKVYGNGGEDIAYNIRIVKNQSFLIVGKTGTPTERAWLLKTNLLGDTLWTKKFDESYDSFHHIEETEDSELIITGMRGITLEGWNVALLKTDSLGNVEWEKTYDYDMDADHGYSVQQTSDGGFIVVGSGTPYDVNDIGWIIRTDSVGDILWTKVISSYTESLEATGTICYSVIQVENGDYIVAGHQTQLTYQRQVMLLRIASDIVPVELTNFTAAVNQNKVSLNWQTATETNNSGFEIERTSPLPSPYEGDGATLGWSVVGFVPGFGKTTEPKSYSFIDENVSAGTYQYRLKQIDFDGSFEYSNTVEVEITAPLKFALEQNYPNPFNPSTRISFSIPKKSFVTLKIYDILGREVAVLVNEELETGSFEKTFEASSLASGDYIYRISAMKDGKILFNESKQMLMIK